MRLELHPPCGPLNWMLIARELEDPANWSVFLPNHGPDTDRYRFEEAAKQASGEQSVSLAAYRLLCEPTICSLEYFWSTNLSDIKQHALRVAQLLSLNIEVPIHPITSRLAR